MVYISFKSSRLGGSLAKESEMLLGYQGCRDLPYKCLLINYESRSMRALRLVNTISAIGCYRVCLEFSLYSI